MPNDDLKTYATSTTDFYELLGVTFETSQKDIDRAWRRTALKYHPDKVGADPVAREKFHLAQIGYDILSDPQIKVLYDNARTAREQKRRQNEVFEGKRRQMKDELESRERGFKRQRDDEEGEEEVFERKLRQIAEDGKRRRKEREEALRKEMQDQEQQTGTPSTPNGQKPATTTPPPQSTDSNVPELSRTVKVRWSRLSTLPSPSLPPPTLDAPSLRTLFETFGPVENVFLLKDKRQRLTPSSHHKTLVATGVIVFKSIVGAHAAINDLKAGTKKGFEIFEGVEWANKAENVKSGEDNEGDSVPGTPKRELKETPVSTPKAKGSPFVGVKGSPSLLEFTMMRLKEAEGKRRASGLQQNLTTSDP
ncbi:MAG: hypothetical protein MMC33_008867 [Icmadophila ericetorum]|nr:hypothetical protein [Icmadophila ericetorum]